MINKWEGKKTDFHKKYYVFDGLGSMFFNTLVEARGYVTIKSGLLEKMYINAKSIYNKISEHYMNELARFRIRDHVANSINELLKEALSCFKYIGKPELKQYIVAKIKSIYSIFLSAAKLLNMKVLYGTVENLYSGYFREYPRYYGNQQTIEQKKMLADYKEFRKAVI